MNRRRRQGASNYVERHLHLRAFSAFRIRTVLDYIYIYLFIYIRSTVHRALNLLRASFSPIFQYFSAVNVTRVSFSPVFQYLVTYVYVYTLYIRMPCATELFDVRHGFFGPEGRVLNKGRRDSLSADLRIEKEQGRVADRRLRRKGS